MTKDEICMVLRMAHDVLSISSIQPKREWVGLTKEEMIIICEANNIYHDGLIEDVEAKLKEKNT
jgi:hypothetical protein